MVNEQPELWAQEPARVGNRPPVSIRELAEDERLAMLADPSRCLTPSQAAAHLGVGRTTVYRLMGDGELTSIQIGRSRRIPLASLSAYVARQLASAAQPA